jgi:phosphoserine phosphatase
MRGSGVIACVFDFDETLAPDSTTKFLTERGIDAGAFWRQTREMAEAGWDPTLAWLNLFLDQCGDGRPLGRVSNADLTAFGESLSDDIFPGIPELLSDLRDTVSTYRDLRIEFYVVSGGLRPILEGGPLIREQFTAAYGCELEEHDGVVAKIKRCITFTEKTRYLFEISKGISQDDADRSPYLVNRKVDPEDRRIPFENMVYVGDGLTDIPCFSLLTKFHGSAFGVFDASQEGKAKRALTEFLHTGRVLGMHSPRYGPNDDLGALLRAQVAQICTRIEVAQGQAFGS